MPNQAGPGTPLTDNQRIRYQACYNASDYDAPPYAAMRRVGGGEVVDGVWSWNVSRPNASTELRQNPTDIVFNGPEVLRSKRPGRCTVDYPVRCLHLREDIITADWAPTSTGAFTPTSFVGPKADSWLLWAGGRAFTWLAIERLTGNDKFEVGIVTLPTPGYYGASYNLGTSLEGNIAAEIPANGIIGGDTGRGVPVQDGAWVPLHAISDRYPFHPDFYTLSATAWNTANPTANGSALYPQIPKTGIYEWHFHCSAVSNSSAQGTQIPIWAYADDEAINTYVVRTSQVEIDNYGTELGRSLENLSMTAVNRFTEGETLNFRNISAYAINVLAGFIRIRRLDA